MQSKKVNKAIRIKNIQWNRYMVYIVFLVVFRLFSILLGNRGFTNTNNLVNILRQTAMISIMAIGGTFVIAAGQIDLTVGAISAMSAMLASLVIRETNSIALAVAAGVGIGIVVGALNGFLVTKLRLPAFLATMGMMSVVRGCAMWITNTAAVPIENRTFNVIFGIGNIGGISVLIFWTVGLYLLGFLLFNKTKFGRHTLATGGNEMSAIYSGVKTQRIKTAIFILAGTLSGFAGILYAGRMQAGRFSYGEGDEMSVIAAVVLGGTAMTGGVGSVVGSLFGSILMGIINNALILAGLSIAQQTVVRGMIIIIAVALSNLSQGKKRN